MDRNLRTPHKRKSNIILIPNKTIKTTLTNKTKAIIFGIFEYAYFYFFKEKPDKELKKFFSDIFYTLIATIIATFFLFITNILAGRLLGPTEFGKYGLILGLAHLATTFTTLGTTNGLIKYINLNRKKEIFHLISRVLLLTSINFLIITGIFLTFETFWTRLININKTLFHVFIGFVLFLSLYQIFNSFHKSLLRFKFQAFWKTISSILTIIFFLTFFIFFKEKGGIIYLYALTLTYFIYIIFSIIYIIQHYKPTLILKKEIKISLKRTYSKILTYSRYTMIGGLTWYLISELNKIFLNNYATLAEVGLFHAYLTSSISVISVLYTSFINVFFPKATYCKNQIPIFLKIKKLAEVSFLPLSVGIFIVSSIIIKLYGEKYYYSANYVWLFALAGFFYFWGGTITWLTTSEGFRGAKYNLYITIFVGLSSIILNKLLISSYGITGAIFAFLAPITLMYAIPIYILPVQKYVFATKKA